MIENKRILALVPARGNSKGIKDKNIKLLAGLPLIAHTIRSALNSKYVDSVVVTTDSEKIAAVSSQYGARVPFMRPDYLALDTSKTVDAVLHAIEELDRRNEQYDILLLLQPTQPLRTTAEIDEAIESFIKNNYASLVSICEVEEHPILLRTIDNRMQVAPLLKLNSTVRRQDMPKYYKVNGAIYINYIADLDSNTSFNDNQFGYIMDRLHSIDIDEPIDLKIAELYLEEAAATP
ncbi:MAG: acylneuraminate cytidylyltransferase [Firmicutes bacterium]|nr:acylneuraminate cytidylyltransferase [Bacillota bacterium]